jgi:hypothetical protein
MSLRKVAKVEDTTTITLVDPIDMETVLTNADGSPMTVTVLGPFSKKYKELNFKVQDKRLKQMQRTGGKMQISAEELTRSAREILVGCVVDWNITVEDDPEPCTPEAVARVLEEFEWVASQLDIVIGSEQNFLAKPASS